MTASYQKIFSANPRIGFLSYANVLLAQIASGKIPAEKLADTQRLIFNQRLDAAVTAVLAAMILFLIVEALFQWHALLTHRREHSLHEVPYVSTRWPAGFTGVAHNTAQGDD
jgi:carbon starvation protein